jgi:hypothetical protein
MDELHDALAEWDEQITRLKKELSDWADDKFLTPCRKDPAYSCATILACHTECQRFAGPSALLAEGYLSGKLNPFPERTPGAQALEIAERFRVFFRRPYPTSEAGVERAVQQLAQEIENVMRHNEAPPGASALEIACRFNSAFNICKYIHNRALCGQCCDLSRIIEAAEARGRAERDTERTERDGICFREGVEFGRAQMGKHGSALEATRDLFESLEGWRPTDDWAGVPARLKLLFDRTLHAIEVAKARDQAERDK